MDESTFTLHVSNDSIEPLCDASINVLLADANNCDSSLFGWPDFNGDGGGGAERFIRRADANALDRFVWWCAGLLLALSACGMAGARPFLWRGVDVASEFIEPCT